MSLLNHKEVKEIYTYSIEQYARGTSESVDSFETFTQQFTKVQSFIMKICGNRLLNVEIKDRTIFIETTDEIPEFKELSYDLRQNPNMSYVLYLRGKMDEFLNNKKNLPKGLLLMDKCRTNLEFYQLIKRNDIISSNLYNLLTTASIEHYDLLVKNIKIYWQKKISYGEFKCKFNRTKYEWCEVYELADATIKKGLFCTKVMLPVEVREMIRLDETADYIFIGDIKYDSYEYKYDRTEYEKNNDYDYMDYDEYYARYGNSLIPMIGYSGSIYKIYPDNTLYLVYEKCGKEHRIGKTLYGEYNKDIFAKKAKCTGLIEIDNEQYNIYSMGYKYCGNIVSWTEEDDYDTYSERIIYGRHSGYDEQGTLYYENGNIMYKGEWLEGKYNGLGTLYYENGNIIYKGEWSEGKYNGQGILYYENGNIIYKGEWSEGEYNGLGTLYCEDKNIIYEGKWLEGIHHGQGKLYDETGALKYSGDWVEEKYYGFGTLYDGDGNILRSGLWYKDVECEDKEEYDKYESGKIMLDDELYEMLRYESYDYEDYED